MRTYLIPSLVIDATRFHLGTFFEAADVPDVHRERAQIGLLKHYHRNPHHPEHWLLKPRKALPIPRRYLLEMLCDWRAFGSGDEGVTAWYLDDKDELTLHPATRAELETLLGLKPSGPQSEEADRVKKATQRPDETYLIPK